MGVYIKDMEMPESCMDCPFKGFDRANGRGNICTIDESITLHAVLDGLDVKFVKMGNCPLIEVPPHGGLIDVDALDICKREQQAWQDYEHNPDNEYLEGVKDGLHEASKQLSTAMIIIEAEKSKGEI